ncbi:MAG TPA: c-type cytochrome [Gaiellaceae bacterium]|jgi:cytochrome c6
MRIVLGTALVLALAGCGGSGGSSSSGTGHPTAGKQVFLDNDCGACHTLKAAGADGTRGPNLDKVDLGSFDDVVKIVTKGKNVMPSYEEQLSPQQIDDVSAYVLQAAGGG